ncbi:MAG: hypothetical protein K9J12_12740 [Melioribacteraceae bacterium]|nr:hypothetical protein [Melioribacteraceae bacterium]MCF8430487.1 hypothetical protein [Melioribacteraceae bacterium]
MKIFQHINRTEFIEYLIKIGFDGPYAVGRHQFMMRGDSTIKIPCNNQIELDTAIPYKILKNAGLLNSKK